MKGLRRLHVLAIGLCLIVAIPVATAFVFIRPRQADIESFSQQALQAKTKADQLPGKQQQLQAAQLELDNTRAQLAAAYVSKAKVTLTDRWEATQWVIDKFGAPPFGKGEFLKSVAAFVQKTGVRLLGMSVGFPAGFNVSQMQLTDPNQRIMPVAIQNFRIQCKGTPELAKFLRILPQMPYLGTISRVSITGPASLRDYQLTVALPLQLYILTDKTLNPSAAPPAAPPTEGAGSPAPGMVSGPQGAP